jgi:hypothetical protein
MPCIDVVGYQSFGGPCCLHLQDLTPCNVEKIGYQRFGGLYCLLLQVVTLCSDEVGYQLFWGPCWLHLLVFVSEDHADPIFTLPWKYGQIPSLLKVHADVIGPMTVTFLPIPFHVIWLYVGRGLLSECDIFSPDEIPHGLICFSVI